MNDIGINVETFGIEVFETDETSIKSSKYNEFYEKAIVDITQKVKSRKR
jgi:hypothetical protein